MEVKKVVQKFDLADMYWILWQFWHSLFDFKLSFITSFQLHWYPQCWQRGIAFILSHPMGYWQLWFVSAGCAA
ncbi:hypothetical protein [Planococcus maritimus]|uniref:hypothetical protein n=1 Tax=Planococcus maritimus TaxID=192421 RepID=UPI001F1EDE58|nr:hypothetical protein [Planococcus maritimus]